MPVIRFPNGTVVDHIVFAVPETRAGCEHIADLTGVEPYLMTEPEPGAYYWSGGLNLGDGQLLEVVGPNPAFTSFHPLHALLSSISELRLLFWYVLVDDMSAYGRLAAGAGRPLTAIDSVEPEDQSYSAYARASLSGPIDPVVPNVIRWTRRREHFRGASTGATMRGLRLGHPDHEGINALFAELGIAQGVDPAETSTVELDLDTPRGLVTLRGEGNPAAGFSFPPGSAD
jgi:hypothetical protein